MRTILVNDKMQTNYRYLCTEAIGENFHPDFKPELTPKEMLELGVFGGKYMTDCQDEFPKDWFVNAKLCSTHHNQELNFFKINASLPLSVWQKKRLDPSRRPKRMVSVVLSLLFRQTSRRRFKTD